MPAATYPIVVTHAHWTGDPGSVEQSALHLLDEFTELDERALQQSEMPAALVNLIEAAAPRTQSHEITMQPTDYFGHARPYDCDDLLEFYARGREIPGFPPVVYQVLESAGVAAYASVLRRVLLEPELFDGERLGLEETLTWLGGLPTGRLLILCRREG